MSTNTGLLTHSLHKKSHSEVLLMHVICQNIMFSVFILLVFWCVIVVVHRNWWWRSSALLPSALSTEVAVESDPRLAGLGTVWAWEETGIVRSISWCLSSFPALLDLYAAPLLKCVHGVSGVGSPSSPVMSAGLKLLGAHFCMACAGLHAVFESLERLALLSLPRSELPKHQLLR